MQIIRYQDKQGTIGYAAQQPDGSALKLAGDIYGSPKITAEKIEVAKLLAPIYPTSIICIGLNYRKHAEETGGNCQCNETTDILLRQLREQVETVHCRNSRYEYDAKTTRGSGSGLNSTVLLGTKRTSKEATEKTRLGNYTRRGFKNGKAQDRTEKLRAKSETSLQTKIDIGCSYDGAKSTTDGNGTDSELVGLLGHIWVDGERLRAVVKESMRAKL